MGDSDQKSGRASYSTSPFVRLLEAPGRVKMLDVFLRKHYSSLSASQVAELGDIDPSTFHRNIDDLVELDIILEDEPLSGTSYYHLNDDSEIAQILQDARRELVKQSRPIISATEESHPLTDKEVIRKFESMPKSEDDSPDPKETSYHENSTVN